MNIVELISKNADIYDALADVYGIDLIEQNTLEKLVSAINKKIESHELCIEDYMSNEHHEEHDDEPVQLNNGIAQLAMIKGFLDVLIYRETTQYHTDEYLNFIFTEANKYYKTHTDMDLSQEAMSTFEDNDIRNTDDLSDNDEEFNTNEYDAFDDALTTWEAFERRNDMENSVR